MKHSMATAICQLSDRYACLTFHHQEHMPGINYINIDPAQLPLDCLLRHPRLGKTTFEMKNQSNSIDP